MRAFRPVPGGWSSAADARERAVLAQAAMETAAVIGDGRLAEPTEPLAGSGVRPGTSPAGPELGALTAASGTGLGSNPGAGEHDETGPERRGRETPSSDTDEDALLAALDFEPDGHTVSDAPDPALDLLLPPAAPQDPELTAQVRATHGAGLRALKVDRLSRLARELAAPSGPDGEILVPAGEEGDWLAAINDLRLLHASRLGLSSDEDVERARRHSQRILDNPTEEPTRADLDEVRWAIGFGVYELLTWWQESLLTSVLSAE